MWGNPVKRFRPHKTKIGLKILTDYYINSVKKHDILNCSKSVVFNLFKTAQFIAFSRNPEENCGIRDEKHWAMLWIASFFIFLKFSIPDLSKRNLKVKVWHSLLSWIKGLKFRLRVRAEREIFILTLAVNTFMTHQTQKHVQSMKEGFVWKQIWKENQFIFFCQHAFFSRNAKVINE